MNRPPARGASGGVDAGAASASEPRRVLVVDDSALGRKVLHRTLTAAGFEVLEAADGVEGAVIALRERPLVVITDLEMPTMDGYQLLWLLKSDPATAATPVLVVTSHDEAPSRFWGRRAGADAYLTKDHQPNELVAVVEALAARARSQSGTFSLANVLPRAPEVVGPLDVLARLAAHLDRSLLRATLTNTLLERGVMAATLVEAAVAALRTLAEVVDAEILGVALADAEGTSVHILLPRPGAAATVRGLEERLLAALPRSNERPTVASAQVSTVVHGEVVPGAAPRHFSDLVLRALPLRDARGVVAVEPREMARYQALSREHFESLLGPLAVVLDNARLGQRLAELSMLDGLTRLLNHRAIYQRLTEELARARRYGHPLAVVLCDFDNFKGINDTHGHLAGDAVLESAAAVMRPCLRTPDLLGRYGGEEFLAVLPESDLAAGIGAAERLRMALALSATELPNGERLAVTGSFGVAEACELDRTASAQALVSLADSRLYEAKAEGRNTVRPLSRGLLDLAEDLP